MTADPVQASSDRLVDVDETLNLAPQPHVAIPYHLRHLDDDPGGIERLRHYRDKIDELGQILGEIPGRPSGCYVVQGLLRGVVLDQHQTVDGLTDASYRDVILELLPKDDEDEEEG